MRKKKRTKANVQDADPIQKNEQSKRRRIDERKEIKSERSGILLLMNVVECPADDERAQDLYDYIILYSSNANKIKIKIKL